MFDDGRVQRLVDKFRYPYAELMGTKFEFWVKDQAKEVLLDSNNSQLEKKIDALADVLGYEWDSEPGWVKKMTKKGK